MSMDKSIRKSRTSKGNNHPIYARGRVIGQVRSGTFYKSIAPNHYLQKPPAIAFSLDSLRQAESAGANQVEVKDRETGTLYRASLAKIREKGFPVNRAGFEPQWALALEEWSKQTKGGPVQEGLFGGSYGWQNR